MRVGWDEDDEACAVTLLIITQHSVIIGTLLWTGIILKDTQGRKEEEGQHVKRNAEPARLLRGQRCDREMCSWIIVNSNHL